MVLPPNISSLTQIGRLASKYPQAHPVLFARMSHFYKTIPKTVKAQEPGFINNYIQKNLKTGSSGTFVHILALLIPLGYFISYKVGGHGHPLNEFH